MLQFGGMACQAMPMSCPTYTSLFKIFGQIGVSSFGGPAAQIALMQRVLVEEQRWLSQDQFLRALSFCMLLPGPEAMQLATYAGWRLRGVLGGVLAGTLFVAPGAIVIAALALIYAAYGARPETSVILFGVKACVLVIVAQALVRLAQKALGSRLTYALAGSSFIAIFVFQIPFPIIIACSAAIGAWMAPDQVTQESVVTQKTSPIVLAAWALAWLAPLPILWVADATLLFDLAAFFAKLAVVTFGGAYAVLAYMTQEVVELRGWLETGQMVDALGLAETTPGPLILITQFVGMIAGHDAGGPGFALLAGLLTLWMTFVPCFLWIFAGAPYVEILLARPKLAAALRAISAAVVGVILNLSVWFALHVAFQKVGVVQFAGTQISVPVWSSFVWHIVPLMGLSYVLLIRLQKGVLPTLVASALGALALASV
jgi:chromate transporter